MTRKYRKGREYHYNNKPWWFHPSKIRFLCTDNQKSLQEKEKFIEPQWSIRHFTLDNWDIAPLLYANTPHEVRVHHYLTVQHIITKYCLDMLVSHSLTILARAPKLRTTTHLLHCSYVRISSLVLPLRLDYQLTDSLDGEGRAGGGTETLKNALKKHFEGMIILHSLAASLPGVHSTFLMQTIHESRNGVLLQVQSRLGVS